MAALQIIPSCLNGWLGQVANLPEQKAEVLHEEKNVGSQIVEEDLNGWSRQIALVPVQKAELMHTEVAGPQIVKEDLNGWLGQFALIPEQKAELMHSDVAGLQIVEEDFKVTGGQAAEVPVQKAGFRHSLDGESQMTLVDANVQFDVQQICPSQSSPASIIPLPQVEVGGHGVVTGKGQNPFRHVAGAVHAPNPFKQGVPSGFTGLVGQMPPLPGQ